MNAPKDNRTLQRIRDALNSGLWNGQVLWLYWLHNRVMHVIGNLLAINVRHGQLRNFAVQEIQNRKNRGSDHHDIPSKLFDVQRVSRNNLVKLMSRQWLQATS